MSAAQPVFDDKEYEGLQPRLLEAERNYKMGNVDELTEDPRPDWTFEKELNELEVLVSKYRHKLLSDSPAWVYKFEAILAEAKEYYGSASPAYLHERHCVAQELLASLPKRISPETSPDEIATLKNKIRVIVTGLEYLLTVGDFGSAIARAEELLRYIDESGLATSKDPARLTRAVVYNLLGKGLRQRGLDNDNKRAIEYFYQSSELYSDMARNPNDPTVDVVYARTRAMVTLAFGAGFLFHHSQSDLVRAKALIAQARLAFLKDTGGERCKLHFYYLEQLYASVLRAEVGDTADRGDDTDEERFEQQVNKQKLERAGKILKECEERVARNAKYLIFVLLDQASLHIYSGPDSFAAARTCINRLLDLCRDNPRLLANTLVLKSHLERREGNYKTALTDAINAHTQATNHPPVMIEALLARGQAQLKQEQFDRALADYEQALRLNNNSNPKLTVITQLLIVELAMAQKDRRLAEERFNQVTHMMPTMSHGYILRKYRRLKRQLPELQPDFLIRSDCENLNYKQWETKLQHWLLDKARSEESGNITNIAKRLDVSKKTVYFWLDKFREQL